MADVAHHVGPASPKPSATVPQQASWPDSPDKGKLRVFISYSRDDLDFADQLDAALDACGFACVLDRHGISGGEDWKRRLGNLISEADEVRRRDLASASFPLSANRWRARARRRGCGTSTTSFSMRTPSCRVRASAPVSPA